MVVARWWRGKGGGWNFFAIGMQEMREKRYKYIELLILYLYQMEKSNRNVRFKRLFLLMVFGLVATGLQAQVSVTVNGDRTYTLSGNSGIYFNNDTMWVGNDEYPLESVQVITFRTVLGINEVVQETMNIAPNPASESFVVSGVGQEPQRMVLYSTAGLKLMEQTVSDGTKVDISHLSEGLYVMRCGNRVAKIVKQ